MRRVVITGMGSISPLGPSVKALFDGQLAGTSAVGPITRFDAHTFPTTFAAEVKDFDLARYVPDASPWQGAWAGAQFAAAASRLALLDAGLLDDDHLDRTRAGVYLGTGEGAQDFQAVLGIVAECYDPTTRKLAAPRVGPVALGRYDARNEYHQELHTPSALLAEAFGLEGPNFASLTACAAGSQAIGEALDLIRRGDADVMVTGGEHSMIYPLGVTGFNLLTALSTRNDEPQKASRPFDLHRDGFVLGEGSGMVVLEELEHARKRGAKIYAELTGYGSTADAFRITDSHEEGRGAIACIRAAIGDSGLAPEQIDYINAHGTATTINDENETNAIKDLFGGHAYKLAVSSTKSMHGHPLGAGGGIEAAVCIKAMQEQWVPPTIGLDEPDPKCDLDYVPNKGRSMKVGYTLSNSFAFGGLNTALVFGPPPG